MSDIDSTGKNTKLYKKLFKQMSDREFDSYMRDIRDGEGKLFIMLPNMKNSVTMNDIMDVAKKYNVKTHSRLVMNSGNRKYKPDKKVLMLKLPVRRVKQYLFNKISLPDADNKVNILTGQVMNEDKGAKITDIETKILANKGLDEAIIELIKIRGGDTKAYQEAKRVIEETGSLSWNDLEIDSTTRSVVIAGMFLNGLMLDHNLGG
jgi:hypothetical protein